MNKMKHHLELYSYYRSSASYRVRIALNLKEINYEYKSVYKLRHDDSQFSKEFYQKNPQGLVPLLIIDREKPLSQSLAIIDWLEVEYPQNSLYPTDAFMKAKCQSFALHIVCDIHPLNVMRVKKYLTDPLKHTKEEKMKWYFHWMKKGFDALEAMLVEEGKAKLCCFSNKPTVADICLISQVYNAKRFHFPLDNYPRIQKINEYCLTLSAFKNAAPEMQPDATEYDINSEY